MIWTKVTTTLRYLPKKGIWLELPPANKVLITQGISSQRVTHDTRYIPQLGAHYLGVNSWKASGDLIEIDLSKGQNDLGTSEM